MTKMIRGTRRLLNRRRSPSGTRLVLLVCLIGFKIWRRRDLLWRPLVLTLHGSRSSRWKGFKSVLSLARAARQCRRSAEIAAPR